MGSIAAVIAAGTFGMIPLFSIPLMEAGMNEASILFYRVLFSGTAIAAVCLAKGKSIKISRTTALRLLGMSFIYTATAVALMYSYNYIASGTVTTIHFLYPVIVALLMAVLYKEKISAKIMGAAFFTLAGVALLSWTGNGFSNAKGVALALSTAVTYALYIVGLNQKGIKYTDSKVVILYIMMFCTAIFGSLAHFTGGISAIPGTSSWINILLLAFVPTIISNMALVKAVKYAGATITSILGSAEPLVAVAIGVTIFSEILTLNGIAGLVVIIAAVSYVIVSESKKGHVKESDTPAQHTDGTDSGGGIGFSRKKGPAYAPAYVQVSNSSHINRNSSTYGPDCGLNIKSNPIQDNFHKMNFRLDGREQQEKQACG